MRALIIDDEPPARHELRQLLSAHPEIEVVGEAGNVREAANLMEVLSPEMLFLDIRMPGGTGFDLLESLMPPHPRVIFTTAYDQFALKAFELNALDYLLKPVEPARLAASLRRISGGAVTRPAQDAARLLDEAAKVFVRQDDRCWFIPVRTIRLIESEGNYSRLHFGGEAAMINRSLNTLEQRLPGHLFIRANRAQLINLDFVVHVTPWFSGGIKVRLRGGPEVEFSRRSAQEFRDRMSF